MMKAIVITLMFLLLASTSVEAAKLKSKILKISAEEQVVVVKAEDGNLKLLKIGNMIDEDKRIIAFEEDHVVLEGPGEWGPVRYVVDVSAGQMHILTMARRPLEKHVFGGMGK